MIAKQCVQCCLLLTAFLATVVFIPRAHAEEFSSTDFTVLHPVLVPAGYSTSTSFQLIGTIGELAIGTSTASGFEVRAGSLYFGEVAADVTPTPSPSGGAGGSAPRPRATSPTATVCPFPTTDLNCDGRTDLRDLSVFLYLSPRQLPNVADFNKDARVDLYDFSALLASWTGRLIPFASEELQQFAYGMVSPEAEERSATNLAAVAQTQQEQPSDAESSAEEIGEALKNTLSVRAIVGTVVSHVLLLISAIARTISHIGAWLSSLW